MYDELVRVVDESRVFVHGMVAVVERLHEGSNVTVPMRAVLEFLRDREPHTVSDIARARRVTRQHIQTIVNDLIDADLATRVGNPRHRRAPLIALTAEGERTIDAMHQREREAIEPVLASLGSLTSARLVAAAEVLAELGTCIELLTMEVTA